MKRTAMRLALILLASPALADGKGITWAEVDYSAVDRDAGKDTDARTPREETDEKRIIWAEADYSAVDKGD